MFPCKAGLLKYFPLARGAGRWLSSQSFPISPYFGHICSCLSLKRPFPEIFSVILFFFPSASGIFLVSEFCILTPSEYSILGKLIFLLSIRL